MTFSTLARLLEPVATQAALHSLQAMRPLLDLMPERKHDYRDHPRDARGRFGVITKASCQVARCWRHHPVTIPWNPVVCQAKLLRFGTPREE